jgi:hypothetical protein
MPLRSSFALLAALSLASVPAHAATIPLCTGTTGTSPCPLPGTHIAPADSAIVLAGNAVAYDAVSPSSFYADSGAFVIRAGGSYSETGWAWMRVFTTSTIDNSGSVTSDGFIQLEDDAVMTNRAGATVSYTTDFTIYDDGKLLNEGTVHAYTYTYTLIDPSNDPPGDPDNPTIDNRGLFVNHAGADVAADGEFFNSGEFDNLAGGTYDNTGRMLNTGLFVNDGAITNARYDAAGARIVNAGDFRISAAGSLDRGSAVIPMGSYWQTSGRTTARGSIREALVYIMGGRLHGTGPLTATVRVGDGGAVQAELSPGDSTQLTATLAIAGSLALGANARTVLDLGAGSAHDLVTVTGADTLGGELALRLVPGNSPAPNETLTVVTSGAIAGTFASVSLDGLPAAGRAEVFYEPTRVRVVVHVPLAVEPAPSGRPDAIRFATLGVGTPRALALDLPRPATVRIALVDVGGRQVAIVFDGALAAGAHRIALPAPPAANGVYFARASVIDAAGTHACAARVIAIR